MIQKPADYYYGVLWNKLYKKSRLIFVAPPSWDELVARLAGRGTEDEGERARRLATARVELRAAGEFDHVIVNDTVSRATDELEGLMGLSG